MQNPFRKFPYRIVKRNTGSWEVLMEMLKKAAGESKIGQRDWKRQIDQYFGTNYVCIDKKALAVASVPIHLYEMRKMGFKSSNTTRELSPQTTRYLLSKPNVLLRMAMTRSTELVEIESHAGIDILTHVNKKMTRHDLFYLTETFLGTTGNCFWKTDKPHDPTELYFLYPQYIKDIERDDNGNLTYIYIPGKKEEKHKDDVVIHFWKPGPFDDKFGFSPVVAASYPIAIESQILQYTDSRFRNMGLPPVIMTLKQKLDKDDFDRWKEQMDQIYGGIANAGKPGYFDNAENLEIKEVANSPKDMEYTEGAKLAREWICNVHGVPLNKLTMESSNRAVAQEGNRGEWWPDTIVPECTRIEEEMTENLAPKFGTNLFYAFEDPVPIDQRMKILERRTNLSTGFSTVDEEREKDNIEPTPGGDIRYMPATMMPVGTGSEEHESEEDNAEAIAQRAFELAMAEINKRRN